MTQTTTKRLTRIALATTLIIISTFINIPLAYIPFTMQNFSILLIALIFKPIDSFLSALLYMLLGLIGLPVFSGLTGGISSVFKPSFGYIIAFVIVAYITSFLYHRKKTRKNAIISMIIGEVIIYAIGLIYMTFILNIHLNMSTSLIKILSLGFFPFIPGDILKMILIVILYPRLEKAISQ